MPRVRRALSGALAMATSPFGWPAAVHGVRDAERRVHDQGRSHYVVVGLARDVNAALYRQQNR